MDPKKDKRYTSFELGIILLFWLILFASPFLFDNNLDDINWNQITRSWERNVPLLFAFVVNRFFLVPELFFKNKRLLYLFSIFFLIVFVNIGVRVLANGTGAPQDPPAIERRESQRINRPQARMDRARQTRRQAARRTRRNQRSATLSFLCLLVIAMDTGLISALRLTKTEQEKAALENENISNQLAFLRSQVSPHFFMNTLNNIHSLIDIEPSEAKESIIKLSKLMRHLLYESESETIPLSKELEFVSSYINLMKLRFSDKVKITVELPDPVPNKRIPPLLFTSILENAFNYGVSYDHPSFIEISISCSSDKLHFLIKNSNYSHFKKKSSTGIGLVNTRKRLNLLYKDNYTMHINDQEDVFTVTLNLPV